MYKGCARDQEARNGRAMPEQCRSNAGATRYLLLRRALAAARLQAGDFLQQRCRGLARHKWDDHNPPTGLLDSAPFILVEGIQGVVATFDVNIRSRGSQEPRRG